MGAAANPKVSVILVTYKQAAYVAKAIASLQRQSYRDWELIVVDDVSPDDTVAAARAALSPRPSQAEDTGTLWDSQTRLVVHERNLGQYQTYNDALRLARGEYVMFGSGDDLCLPELLAAEAAALDRHPAAGLAFANVYLIDEADRILGDMAAPRLGALPWLASDCTLPAPKAQATLLRDNFIFCIGGVLLRRACLQAVGGWDESLPQAADWDLWLRLAACYDLAYVARPLLGWRQHRDTVTSRLRRSGQYYEDIIGVIEKAFASLPEGGERLAGERERLLAEACLAEGCADLAAERLERGKERLARAGALGGTLLADPGRVAETLCRHGVSLLSPTAAPWQVAAYVERVVAALPTRPGWWPERRRGLLARALLAAAQHAREAGQFGPAGRLARSAIMAEPGQMRRREALSLLLVTLPGGRTALSLYRRLRPRPVLAV
ncbi:MAG: glycosyltransferase [Chloroflexi bacterium]|nr:glycosyltransferase [Chloroflexota bacterium]